MLDALRQIIHLRAYAQKKPIDEYKHEAFALFERMLSAIREDVTRTLAHAEFTVTTPDFGIPPELVELPGLPEFITNHIDPFSGEDDTADIDAATGTILSRVPPLSIPQPSMPQLQPNQQVLGDDEAKVSRNAQCPCGSGRKYKHCHGAL